VVETRCRRQDLCRVGPRQRLIDRRHAPDTLRVVGTSRPLVQLNSEARARMAISGSELPFNLASPSGC
jgi:hypothetical protein